MATQAVMARETWSHGGKTTSRYVPGNPDGYSIRNSVRKGKNQPDMSIIRYANLHLQDGTSVVIRNVTYEKMIHVFQQMIG